jgi:hypothetical protein
MLHLVQDIILPVMNESAIQRLSLYCLYPL